MRKKRLQDKTKIRRKDRKARRVGLIFKTGFVILFAGLLYRHIRTMPVSGNWDALFTWERLEKEGVWLLLAVALMPLNWSLETLKWQRLMCVFGAVSFRRAFAAVLSGVTISLFTPNRIGEYGGRLLALDPRLAWGTVISSLLGTWIQWMVLLVGGVLGFYHLAVQYELTETGRAAGLGAAGMALAAGAVLALFRIPVLAALAQWHLRGQWRRRVLSKLLPLRHYSGSSIGLSLLWAALRYMVYCTQYYLMLRFFGIHIPAGEAAAGIAAIFLAQTSLPLPPLAGLIARGELALWVWGLSGADTASILGAAYGLFIINLSLPSLVGAWILLRLNLRKFWKNERKNMENSALDAAAADSDRL